MVIEICCQLHTIYYCQLNNERETRTFWFLAAAMGLDVLGSGERTNPVLPPELDFDNLDGLVTRVVSKVLEEDSS